MSWQEAFGLRAGAAARAKYLLCCCWKVEALFFALGLVMILLLASINMWVNAYPALNKNMICMIISPLVRAKRNVVQLRSSFVSVRHLGEFTHAENERNDESCRRPLAQSLFHRPPGQVLTM